MATGLTGPSASPLAGRSSPADPNAWLHGPLSNTFFADPAFDDPLTLTGRARRLSADSNTSICPFDTLLFAQFNVRSAAVLSLLCS